MRSVVRLLGNLLILASLVAGGVLLVQLGSGTSGGAATASGAVASGDPASPTRLQRVVGGPGGAPRIEFVEATTDAPDASAPEAALALPITRVVIESIGLDTPVQAARLVEKDGALTWDVPAHAAGHAEGTAGAGAPGNAVVMGHVESVRSGDVFRELGRVQHGDVIQVYSDDRRFDYRVAERFTIARTDLQAVAPTETPSISLFTCTGVWLPLLWDYTERLVVRGELVARS